MTVVNMMNGTYVDVIQGILEPEFATAVLSKASYQDNLAQIFKDLPRTRLLNAYGKNADDFVRDWVNTQSFTYTQGNMTASLFEVILILHIQRAENLDIQECMLNSKALNFAYYNNEGILCGVAFSYLENDPSLWTASIIRNTTAASEVREVLVISSSSLLQGKGQALNLDEAYIYFLAFLKSQDLKQRFEKIILSNGKIDIEGLKQLEEVPYISDEHPILASRRRQFDAFVADNQHIKQKLEINRQLSLNLMRDSTLDWMLASNYFRRNGASFTFITVLSLVIVVSALVLSGVFAPFGFVIAAGLTTYLASMLVTIASIGVIASVAKVSLEEASLSEYQKANLRINQDFDAKIHKIDSSFELRCREHLSDDETDDFKMEARRLADMKTDPDERFEAERKLARVPDLVTLNKCMPVIVGEIATNSISPGA